MTSDSDGTAGADPDGSDPDGADPDGADPDGADPDGSDSDLTCSDSFFAASSSLRAYSSNAFNLSLSAPTSLNSSGLKAPR